MISLSLKAILLGLFAVQSHSYDPRYSFSTNEQSVQTCFTGYRRPGICVETKFCQHYSPRSDDLDLANCTESGKVCCPYGNEVQNMDAFYVPRWTWDEWFGNWSHPTIILKPPQAPGIGGPPIIINGSVTSQPSTTTSAPKSTTPSNTPSKPTTGGLPSGPPSPSSCGARMNLPKEQEWQGTPLIVGGNVAAPHTWPWMVGVYSSGRFICGGCIIDQRYVLCAAHCVSHSGRITKADQIQLLIGAHDRRSSGQKIAVEKVIVHSGYNERIMQNDISLFKLAQPITFNKNIQPICLPQPGSKVCESDKTTAFLAGWGTTSAGGSTSNELREVSVPIIPLKDCQKSYDSSMVTSKQICAGYLGVGGKDTCQGDSGGPLVVKPEAKTNQYVQCGIVSWGRGCAESRYPGVYTKVSEFMDWIKANKV